MAYTPPPLITTALLPRLDRAIRILFYVTLVLLFLRPSWCSFTTPVGDISCTSAKNIAVITVLFWLAAVILSSRRYLCRNTLELPLAAGVTVCVISALCSPFGNLTERLNAVVELLFYCGFFYVSLLMLSRKGVERCVVILLFCGAVAVACGNLFYHFKVGIWRIVDQDYPFWDGKNALGLFMVMALALSPLARPAPEKHSRTGWLPVIGFYTGVVLIFLCAVYSYSRGAWLALVAAVATLGLLRSWKSVGTATIVLFLLLWLLPHQKAYNRFLSIPRMRDGNVAKRQVVWRNALKMMRDYPLAGVGPGVFRTACTVYGGGVRKGPGGEETAANLRFREHAHNLFLQVGAENGIPGLIILLWGGAVVLCAAWRRARRHGDARRGAAALCAAFSSFLLFSMVDCSWTGRFSGSSFMHINLLLALFVAMALRENNVRPLPETAAEEEGDE